MKMLVNDEIPDELERQRLALNDVADRCDQTCQKLATIEKFLPGMIQEILEYYFDKKVADHQAKLVTLDHFNQKMGQKLEANIFYNYEKRQANQKIEDNTFKLEERIHKLERGLIDFVTKDEHQLDIEARATTDQLTGLREEFHKLQSSFVTSDDHHNKEFSKYNERLE